MFHCRMLNLKNSHNQLFCSQQNKVDPFIDAWNDNCWMESYLRRISTWLFQENGKDDKAADFGCVLERVFPDVCVAPLQRLLQHLKLYWNFVTLWEKQLAVVKNIWLCPWLRHSRYSRRLFIPLKAKYMRYQHMSSGHHSLHFAPYTAGAIFDHFFMERTVKMKGEHSILQNSSEGCPEIC